VAKDKNPAITPVERATPGRKRTECPVSKDKFLGSAKPITINVNGQSMVATPKEFATGSFGFYANQKLVFEVDGEQVGFQVGLTITAIGSKPTKD
jgi:hypothetical protein